MATALYAEVNGMCILILLLLAYWTNKSSKAANKQQLVRTFFYAILFFASDFFWALVEKCKGPEYVEWNYLANFLYFTLSGLCAYIWFLYVEDLIGDKRWKKSRYIRLVAAVPMAALAVLTALSRLTGWIFSITEENVYVRGPLHWIQIVISVSYLVFSSVHSFCEARRARAFMEKEQLTIISTFVIMPLVCGIAQNLVAPGLPLLCAGITISFLVVFVCLQDRMITRDALTQLNNRYRLINYLEEKTELYKLTRPRTCLYLLMSDIDSFKKINDGFGHLAGDRALCATADALKNICRKWGCFAARYGGDEFVLVLEAESEDTVERLCSEINAEIARADKDIYHLSLSIGYARYDPQTMTITQLLEMADQNFYLSKARHHLDPDE